MKTMTIGKKILGTCTVVGAWMWILGAVAIVNSSRIATDVRSFIDGPLPGIHALGLLSGFVKDEKTAILEHIASETPEEKRRLESSLADLESKAAAEQKVYEKTIQTAKGRELFDRFLAADERFKNVGAGILTLSRELKAKEALAMWNEQATMAIEERARVLNETFDFRKSSGEEDGKAAIAAAESANFWVFTILILSVGSGGLLAFFIVRGINRGLGLAVTELSEGAEQVSSASRQVSGSSQSLAQGASEQAASLEETSASSEEMSSMTRKNAENSQQAAQFMNTVHERVTEANRTLADMTLSMREIGESSGKISKIIKVIDEIAFQTNILALNAAVEAARAGEAGMGFAVVADEVRNLAQRSAQAAKDTAALIEDSILKSGEGSRKLGEVAHSIQAITEGTGKVKVLVDEVEASSKEQATGIEQISKAVTQMDQVTQKTAANAEESASASEELSAQSQALMAVVRQLQAMIGILDDSTVGRQSFRKPGAAPAGTSSTSGASALKRPPSVHIRHGLEAAKPAARKTAPALAGASGHRAAEFPLDDNEFKEF